MKQLIIRLSIVLFISVSLNDLFAQQLPEIIAPAPVARQFQKFLGYPVSPATGTANVSIPLYNLQTAGINIPFSLQYHSSGIKVYDSPGNIGYGWTLFPGFRITRTIMGNPDDNCKTDDIRYTSYPNSVAFDQYLCNMGVYPGVPVSSPDPALNRRLDGQYDIFSVHLPNLNTSFIVQWVNGELKGVPIPEAPVVIKPVRVGAGSGPLYFSYFEVTDDKGIVYVFGKDHKDYLDNDWAATTEWMLEKIIAPGVGNTIDFTYQSSNAPWYDGFTTQSYEVDDYRPDVNMIQSCNYGNHYDNVFGAASESAPINNHSYNTWSLTSMNFPTGRVDFAYSDQGLVKLSSIKVFNSNNAEVKKIEFSRVPDWDLLNTVTVSGEGQYSFEYDMQPFTNPAGNLLGQDFSGYYNGQNNYTLVPSISLTMYPTTPGGGSYTLPIGSANRQPDEVKMQSHILKKIIYPTGGYNKFYYESHKFISKGVPSFGMGLRIASTEVYDPVSNKTITNLYKYGENESGYGNLSAGYYVNGYSSALDEYAFVSDRIMVAVNTWGPNGSGGPDLTMRRRSISSRHRFSNFNFNIPVWYPEVNVYSDGGKTTYRYEYTPSYFVDEPVSLPNGFGTSDTKNYYIGMLRNLGLSGPRLTTKQIRSGQDKLLQETSYTYTGGGAGVTGLIVEPAASYMTYQADVIGAGTSQACYNITNRTPYSYPEIGNGYPSSGIVSTFLSLAKPFTVRSYIIEKNNDNVASITQKDYQDNNVLETVTSFDYEGIPYTFNVNSKSVTTSTNGTITEKYYYPTSINVPDISSLSSAQQAMVGTLLNNNRLTTVIQKSSFRNVSTPISSTLFGYKDWGNNIFAPEQVYTKTGSNAYGSRLHFYNYDDKANVLSVSKENDVKNSYIWGYNKSYPIAQAINANSNEIFFDSFEENVPGWESTLTAYDNSVKRSGKVSGRIDKPTSGELVCLSNKWCQVSLTATKKFKFSGWVYSNGPSVELFLIMKRAGEPTYYSYFDRVETNITGKWVYIEKDADVPSDVVQMAVRLDNNGGGTVWFDDIRLHPSAAMMTTYTYEPLIGMTSQCDVNNRITYYEYDGFGRLNLIRDQDKNILKKICYNYAGQQEQCAVFSSDPINDYYYSQNCPVGQTPVGYYVSVPAGMFSSTVSQTDANQQAAAYAQGQANQNGSCQQQNVTLYYNNSSGNTYYLELYNSSTGQSYWFTVYSGSGTIGDVPAGNYDIYITPANSNYQSYSIGCGYYNSGYNTVYFYGVPLNTSCNYFNMY